MSVYFMSIHLQDGLGGGRLQQGKNIVDQGPIARNVYRKICYLGQL